MSEQSLSEAFDAWRGRTVLASNTTFETLVDRVRAMEQELGHAAYMVRSEKIREQAARIAELEAERDALREELDEQHEFYERDYAHVRAAARRAALGECLEIWNYRTIQHVGDAIRDLLDKEVK